RSSDLEPLIVEMAVHPVEPRRDPAAAGFQKADPDLRMLLADAAPDHSETGQHHLHRMRDDVPRPAPIEAVNTDLRHAGSGAFMEADREIEILGGGPERLVIRMIDHLVVVRVGPDKAALEAELLFGE